MKTYRLSFADSIHHVPEHADRTAKRSSAGTLDLDITYQVWPNRASMAKSIRMQQKREQRSTDWRACVNLSETEGY